MDTQNFNIREYRESDLPGILDLWEQDSGWGRPSMEDFKKWMKTPFGDCLIVVTEDKNYRIVGQIIYTPNQIINKGKIENALKISAPIIHDELREVSLLSKDHPINAMALFAQNLSIKKGILWHYNFPAHAWKKYLLNVHRFGLKPWKVESFNCFEFPQIQSSSNKYSFKELIEFSESISSLWSIMKKGERKFSFFSRDISWLQYKWGDDLKLGIYDRKEKLVGYLVIKKQTGLLLDYISLKMDETPNIFSAASHFYKNSYKDYPNLKYMETSYFKHLLKDSGSKLVDYTFAFGLCPFSNDNNINSIDYNFWYVFPTD